MEHLTSFEVVLTVVSAISGLYGIILFVKLLNNKNHEN
jgi:hypothetical protein